MYYYCIIIKKGAVFNSVLYIFLSYISNSQ